MSRLYVTSTPGLNSPSLFVRFRVRISVQYGRYTIRSCLAFLWCCWRECGDVHLECVRWNFEGGHIDNIDDVVKLKVSTV